MRRKRAQQSDVEGLLSDLQKKRAECAMIEGLLAAALKREQDDIDAREAEIAGKKSLVRDISSALRPDAPMSQKAIAPAPKQVPDDDLAIPDCLLREAAE